MKYTTSFRNSVLKKIIPPSNWSVTSVSKETGVAVVTINNWHRLYSEVGCTSQTAYLVKKTDKTDYTSFRAVSVLSRRYKSYTEMPF